MAAGRSRRARVPPLPLLSSSSRPLSASAACWAIESPSPNPSGVVPPAVEALGCSLALLARHSGPGVHHLERDEAVIAASAQHDVAFRCVLGRVRDQVEESLLGEIAVREDGRLGRTLRLDADSALRPECGHGVQERVDRNGLPVGLLLQGLNARQQQERLHEPLQPLRLLLDVRQEAIALAGIVFRPRLEDLGRAHQRGERRAQLVGGVRDELPLGPREPGSFGQVPVRGDGAYDVSVRVPNRRGARLVQHACSVETLELDLMPLDRLAGGERTHVAAALPAGTAGRRDGSRA